MSSKKNEVSPDEWDSVRSRFKSSMMVKTDIGKLAQNIDASWPIKGSDEIPLKYIPLSLEELMMMPGIGEKPERIQLLVDILNETMAFDDPFSEMAEHVDSSSKHDDGAKRVLEKLQIPGNFPIDLCAISPETKEFCAAEEIRTIEQFIEFSQNMAQNVVVGGDFRNFLNVMAHPEEESIARYLPFRPGKKGLHLVEALGQTVTTLPPEAYLTLLDHFGGTPTATDRQGIQSMDKDGRNAAITECQSRINALLSWFHAEAQRAKDAVAEGSASIDRYFAILDNPNVEIVAKGLLQSTLSPDRKTTREKKGFFSRLFGN